MAHKLLRGATLSFCPCIAMYKLDNPGNTFVMKHLLGHKNMYHDTKSSINENKTK
jgi:hypothetical protein